MDECSKCGISEDKTRLFEAIGNSGIVKICDDCSIKENIPVIKKPTSFQLKEAEKKSSIHERLSRMAGITRAPERKSSEVQKQDMRLRAIVDSNYRKITPKEIEARPDLIENFHWVLMRARRLTKLTPEQVAKEIGETESAIRMAEKGVLPEDDYKFLHKLENFYNIKLIEDEAKKQIKEIQKRKPVNLLGFKQEEIKDVTIEDLRKIKEEGEKIGKDSEKEKASPENSELEDVPNPEAETETEEAPKKRWWQF